MTRAQVVGALADTCLIPEACLSCAPYANLSSASAGGLQQATADGVEEEEDVRERGKEGEKVKVGGGGGGRVAAANPCCCAGGKLRAEMLAEVGSVGEGQRAFFSALSNPPMQEYLLHLFHAR